MGAHKEVNGFKVYVKHEDCLDSLKDIFKELQSDGLTVPFIRKTLGDWHFFEKDLIPIMVVHKQDKKLAFQGLKIMALMTQMPVQECRIKSKIMPCLREYKDAFIRHNVSGVLMEHLSDCLQMEERTDLHNNMMELIIVLFKQLLSISDATFNDNSTQNSL